ncbi:hypothetical protein CDAR_103401 [Caerostris darwini]|uniref:Uncharacterized protein n=1 Tax=Caerostris darwini TaxID=1538125 RepID=A0AAV4WCR6_9ARAC|nr:hypothetical protein CDAR_103401 [Caerostris darwini]
MKGKENAHDKNAFWRSATVHTRKKTSVKAFLLRINVKVHWHFEEKRNYREMKSLSKNSMSMLRIRHEWPAVPFFLWCQLEADCCVMLLKILIVLYGRHLACIKIFIKS